MLPIRTILCPLDFSESSYKALQVAVELASHFKGELLLAHFVPPATPGVPADPMLAFAGQETYEQAAKSAATMIASAPRRPTYLTRSPAVSTVDDATSSQKMVSSIGSFGDGSGPRRNHASPRRA